MEGHDEFLDRIENGMMNSCRRMHGGETVELTFSARWGMDLVENLQRTVEAIHRSLYGDVSLTVSELRRDANGKLHVFMREAFQED